MRSATRIWPPCQLRPPLPEPINARAAQSWGSEPYLDHCSPRRYFVLDSHPHAVQRDWWALSEDLRQEQEAAEAAQSQPAPEASADSTASPASAADAQYAPYFFPELESLTIKFEMPWARLRSWDPAVLVLRSLGLKVLRLCTCSLQVSRSAKTLQ